MQRDDAVRDPAEAGERHGESGARRRDERTDGDRRARLGRVTAALLATALLSSLIGAACATVLVQQQIAQEAGDYALVSSSSPNFPTAPTASLGTSFAGCTAGTTYAYPTTSLHAYQLRVVVGVANATGCAANDSAEILDWTSPTTLTSETVHVDAYLSLGATGTPYTVDETLNVTGQVVPSGYTATLELVLDLGSPAPPAIDSLTVTVT